MWRYLCKNGLILFPLHNRESGTNKLYDILDCDKLDALSTLNLKVTPQAFEWSLNGSVSSLFWWIHVQIWPKYKVFIWLYSNGLLTMNLINLVSDMRPQCDFWGHSVIFAKFGPCVFRGKWPDFIISIYQKLPFLFEENDKIYTWISLSITLTFRCAQKITKEEQKFFRKFFQVTRPLNKLTESEIN